MIVLDILVRSSPIETWHLHLGIYSMQMNITPYSWQWRDIIACDPPWNQIQLAYKGNMDEHNENLEIHQTLNNPRTSVF